MGLSLLRSCWFSCTQGKSNSCFSQWWTGKVNKPVWKSWSIFFAQIWQTCMHKIGWIVHIHKKLCRVIMGRKYVELDIIMLRLFCIMQPIKFFCTMLHVFYMHKDYAAFMARFSHGSTWVVQKYGLIYRYNPLKCLATFQVLEEKLIETWRKSLHTSNVDCIVDCRWRLYTNSTVGKLKYGITPS